MSRLNKIPCVPAPRLGQTGPTGQSRHILSDVVIVLWVLFVLAVERGHNRTVYSYCLKSISFVAAARLQTKQYRQRLLDSDSAIQAALESWRICQAIFLQKLGVIGRVVTYIVRKFLL